MSSTALYLPKLPDESPTFSEKYSKVIGNQEQNFLKYQTDSIHNPSLNKKDLQDIENIKIRSFNASYSDLSEVTAQLQEELEEVFIERQGHNWDGYGALPMDLNYFAQALDFLEKIPTGLLKPDVTAENDGCFCFDWIKNNKIFSLTIKDSLIYSYDVGDNDSGMGEKPLGTNADDIFEKIKKIGS